jgi:RHS repeat-associated protein
VQADIAQVWLSNVFDGRGLRMMSTESILASSININDPEPQTHFYFYTPEMQMLNVVARSTGRAADVIWFGSRPVADHDDTTLRYTFTDHLGTPILQTTPAAAIVWRAEYEPYGTVYSLRAGTAADDQPLRFPGQQVAYATVAGGEETYNIFRWYRAGWGRYTQADPATFEGGLNLYAYALDNPIVRYDRNGLTSYKNFPSDKAQTIKEAVKKAVDMMQQKPCCFPDGPKVLDKLKQATFVYEPDLEDCGKVTSWGFLTNTIKIGPVLFDDPSACCSMEALVLHEANHLRFVGTEKSSLDLEKKCFGCV